MCDLLSLAFQPFVQTINSENLLYTRAGGVGDTGKKQSWMSPLEFKRIAFSNEIQFVDGISKVDGNLVKRVASGGDEVEVRTNYKDKEHKRLQATFFLHCNEFPPVTPEDTYETLEVFDFKTTFVDKSLLQGKCPTGYRARDDRIKVWIRRPEVIDAFTVLVLESYKAERVKPPPCVENDTKRFLGPIGESMINRIREVITYVDDPSQKAFTSQMKLALERAGITGLSSQKVGEYVLRLYGGEERPPAYKKYTIDGKKGYGYDRVEINPIVAFDDRQERRNMMLKEREEIRYDFSVTKRQKLQDFIT